MTTSAYQAGNFVDNFVLTADDLNLLKTDVTNWSPTLSGGVSRSIAAKLQDLVSVRDFGAKGDGSTDDTTAFNTAITAVAAPILPASTYALTSGVSLPLNKQLILWPGATTIGTLIASGVLIQFGHNPSGQSSWNSPVTYSYEGLSVDLGGYGSRQYGTSGNPTAINGSIVIPSSTSSSIQNGFGITGFVRNSSTVTNGVALYGEANAAATNAGIWGLNTRSIDNGYSDNAVWGIEIDCNITNPSSWVRGVDVTGASTVEPSVAPAVRVGPLGVYTTPYKRWSQGVQITDGSSQVAIEIGAAINGANSGAMPINWYFVNGSNARTSAATITVDSAGNVSFNGLNTGSELALGSWSGANQKQIVMANAGLAFFNGSPTAKQTVTGAKGGNAALASLLTALANYGLITDGSTA